MANLAEVEEQEGKSAAEVAAPEAAVAEAEPRLSSALVKRRQGLPRCTPWLSRSQEAALGEVPAPAFGRALAAVCGCGAREARRAAELIRDAERLSAESRDAEEQAVASARARASPILQPSSRRCRRTVGDDEIDLTRSSPDTAAPPRPRAADPDLSSEIS